VAPPLRCECPPLSPTGGYRFSASQHARNHRTMHVDSKAPSEAPSKAQTRESGVSGMSCVHSHSSQKTSSCSGRCTVVETSRPRVLVRTWSTSPFSVKETCFRRKRTQGSARSMNFHEIKAKDVGRGRAPQAVRSVGWPSSSLSISSSPVWRRRAHSFRCCRHNCTLNSPLQIFPSSLRHLLLMPRPSADIFVFPQKYLYLHPAYFGSQLAVGSSASLAVFPFRANP